MSDDIYLALEMTKVEADSLNSFLRLVSAYHAQRVDGTVDAPSIVDIRSALGELLPPHKDSRPVLAAVDYKYSVPKGAVDGRKLV